MCIILMQRLGQLAPISEKKQILDHHPNSGTDMIMVFMKRNSIVLGKYREVPVPPRSEIVPLQYLPSNSKGSYLTPCSHGL
jgi:hypothetical protein